MRINAISDNNFGIKITDNFPKEMINHFWSKRFPEEVRIAIPQIREMANDSYEITFKELVPGKPCEVWLTNPFELKKFFVEFISVKPRERKRGRPKLHPENHITNAVSPMEFKKILARKLAEFSRK